MRTRVRILNKSGIDAFGEYLERLKQDDKATPPVNLLDDPQASEDFGIEADVTHRPFANRLEAGRYLHSVFDACDRDGLDSSKGLWSWLALYYFDEVCPANGHGVRKPGKPHYYVPGEHAWHYYRHKLAGPYRIYNLHGEEAQILLCGAVDSPGDFNEQLASRQEFVTNSGIIQAAATLYYDEERDKPKSGATPNRRKAGTLRRFVDVIQQLDLTYDLYSMTGEEIVGLLPSEFNSYR